MKEAYMSGLFDRRNVLQKALGTTINFSAVTIKTFYEIEQKLRLSVDDHIETADTVYRRIISGIEYFEK